MPHALFLGSHLAGVDRLDIAPRAPPERGSISYAAFVRRAKAMPRMPRKELLKSLTHRRRAPAQETEAGSESVSRRGSYGGATEYRDSNDRFEEEEEEKWEKEKARYEAEVKAFDRVSFVALSIKHATVSLAYVRLLSLLNIMDYSHSVRYHPLATR